MVVKPLFFEFPSDEKTITIDEQFLLGDALLISPVLKAGATTVSAYFPKTTWFLYTSSEFFNIIRYDYYTGVQLPPEGEGSYVVLIAHIDYIPVHIRGGTIVPKQEPKITTDETAASPYELLIALSSDGKASGILYIDDYESLDSISNKKYALIQYIVESTDGTTRLKSEWLNNGFVKILTILINSSYSGIYDKKLNTVRVYGAARVCNVKLGNTPYDKFNYDEVTKVLEIYQLNISMDTVLDISWSC